MIENETTRAVHARNAGKVEPLTPTLPITPTLPVSHMDECESTEIRRLTKRVAARDQFRTADRKQLLDAKASNMESWGVSLAMTNGKIDVFAREVDVMGLSADPQIDLRMHFGEVAEPMDEPLRREIR